MNNIHLSHTDLIDIVYEIYSSTTDYDERRAFFSVKYPEFANSYSYLFEMTCKPRFNFNKFAEILIDLTKSKKRKRCSEELLNQCSSSSNSIITNISQEALLHNLKDIYNTQKTAVEYLV
jgi:hypothetical protein